MLGMTTKKVIQTVLGPEVLIAVAYPDLGCGRPGRGCVVKQGKALASAQCFDVLLRCVSNTLIACPYVQTLIRTRFAVPSCQDSSQVRKRLQKN